MLSGHMKKLAFYLVVLLVCVVSLSIFTDVAFIGIVIGIISSILFIYIDTIASNLESLKYWWISIRYRNTYIRLSISYLFRIKVDGKYLLVRSARFPQFQPVGGVFKRYPTSTSFFQRINALDDDLLPIDQKSKDDLRIRVKGKYVIEFLKWFNSGKEREISGWREFCEELIRPDYLPQDLFPFIHYQYIRRYEHPLRYSDYAQSREIFIAEIYELVPTDEQEKFLREMSKTESDNFVWVDEDRIRRRGAIPKQDYMLRISEHSQWIL
jgi:hypothetical protein